MTTRCGSGVGLGTGVGEGCRVGGRVGRGVRVGGLSAGWDPSGDDIVVISRVPPGAAVIGGAVQERCGSKVGTDTQAAAVKLHTSNTNNRR